MALSDFTGPDYIEAWTRDLDRRWPERAAMADRVMRTLVGWFRGWDRNDLHGAKSRGEKLPSRIRLLELGVGAGRLALTVLDALSDVAESVRTGAVEYTGIELSLIHI